MLDHIGITVVDLARSREFYVAALKPLGIKPLSEFPGWVGFGKERAQFWIAQGVHTASAPRAHVAFSTDDRDVVKKFYDAAMAAGATDNGPPGLRVHYHKNYYGAFVIDPDGYNIEAVSHGPLPQKKASAKKAPGKKASAKKAPAKKAPAKKAPAKNAPAKKKAKNRK